MTGIARRIVLAGIVDAKSYAGGSRFRKSHPKRAVYRAAPRAHSVPRSDTAPSVPGRTFRQLKIRYAFGERTPISLARVSAPATAKTEMNTSPLSSRGIRIEKYERTATA